MKYKRAIISFCHAAVIVCILTAGFSGCISKQKPDEVLYKTAVEDAMIAEPAEIFPLVCISEDDPLVSWKDGKVLMLTLHKYPDFYAEGKDVRLSFGNSWTFTDREIEAWYKKNRQDEASWQRRIKQLLGIAPS